MPSLPLETLRGRLGIVDGGITLVGEKNLEHDVEENFAEVSRLLGLLGEKPNLRFVRGMKTSGVQDLARGRLNILREPGLWAVGESFAARFGTPYLDSFPVGLSGSLRFLEEVALLLGLNPAGALGKERAFQDEALGRFEDLRGERITISPSSGDAAGPFANELVNSLGLLPGKDGVPVPLPSPLPVGDRWNCPAAPPLEEGAPCLMP